MVPSSWAIDPTESPLGALERAGVWGGGGRGHLRGVLGGSSPVWHLQPLSHSPELPGVPRSSTPDSASSRPQSRDRKMLGDNSGALSYGSTAKCLNITALVINIVIVIITVIVVTILVVSARHYSHPYG